jgi:hypothetical protein
MTERRKNLQALLQYMKTQLAKYEDEKSTYPSLLGLESGLLETLDLGIAVRVQVHTDEIQKVQRPASRKNH